MTDSPKAVFLSYASQDAEAAQRLCEALRAAGLEVWLDRNELVGGDAWDQKIRKQIKECALLIPIISQNTQARTEGYFRLEWRLADQRTHLMAKGRPFLLPVVIDGTSDAEAAVPDSFTEVQWTKAPAGEVPPAFIARVQKLLTAGANSPVTVGVDPIRTTNGLTPGLTPPATAAARRPRWILPAAVAGVLVVAAAAITLYRNRPESTASTARSPVEESLARVGELLGRPEMARVELELADGLCRKAAELDPSNAQVLAAWSIVHTWTYFHGYDRSPERQEAARSTADKAMRLAPQSYEPRLAQAMFWVRADFAPDRLAEAQRILRQLLQERPDEPRALFALGFCLMNDERTHDEGFALLERLARNPAFTAVALNEVGWLQYFLGRFSLAESAADRSVAARPYWNNLGLQITLALHFHGDAERAKRFLVQMPASILQEDWGVMFAWKTYLWSREPKLALAAVESVQREWVRNFFNDTPRAYLQAVARQAAGQQAAARRDYERALEQFNQALVKTPNNGFCLLHKAVTQRALGQEAAALETYRLLRELKDSMQGDFLALARVQFDSPAEAVAFARTMVQSPFTLAMDNTSRVDFTASALRLNPWFDRLRNERGFAEVLAEATAREAAPETGVLASNAPEKSVAVLAFANLSSDKEQEYFSDGISEELLNVLAKVPGLKVTARTSSFHFKGKDTPVPEIARQLGVAYVVEGSVRRQGNQVRITAQLIKAADGFHVWSDTFTRDLKDIFAVQDEIAGLVAQNLQLKLGVSPRQEAVDPEAFQLLLESRRVWSRRTPAAMDEAERLLSRALERSPGFPRALAAMADVWWFRGHEAHNDPLKRAREDLLRTAETWLDRAMAADPNLAEAYATRGAILEDRNDITGAEAALRRALELNPNYATAHQWYGGLLFRRGEIEPGLRELAMAVQLDPLAPMISSNEGIALHQARRHREALAAFDRVLALAPDFQQALEYRPVALYRLGRQAEAIRLIRERLLAADAAGRPGEGYMEHLIILAESGDKEEAARRLDLLENAFPEMKRWGAGLLMALGRQEAAFARLAEAGAGDTLSTLDPVWDSVRESAQFLALIEKAGAAANYRKAWTQIRVMQDNKPKP